MIAKQSSLFPEKNLARYGDDRHRRNLFLPRFLQSESGDLRLEGDAKDNAWVILKKWAELESSGKLATMNESSLEGEFIKEVFGEALGYKTFAEGADVWEIQAKRPVNGGTPDASIGLFDAGGKSQPIAVIELKGPKVNLDRDRFGGRTPVNQCWDYLNSAPDCPWGIVSNFVSFRLYHRNQTPRACQLFTLQELTNNEMFNQFYYLLERGGLLPPTAIQKPRALALLEKTSERQREVGDELYKYYGSKRHELIQHLHQPPHSKTLDQAIHISQKLLDRIIFVAFCEDRHLLPDGTISRAYSQEPPFTKVTNPKWQNFLALFRSIDHGNERAGIPAFNGGLFKEDAEVDNLQLDDSWTNFFHNVGKYDFRDEVNVDVLGHLFEKSISDVGQIRRHGLLGTPDDAADASRMGKSAERKRGGIYYTPPEFTEFIVSQTLGKLIRERCDKLASAKKIELDSKAPAKPSKKYAVYYRDCLQMLRDLRVVDPACGSGAFLIAAYNLLEDKYGDVIDHIAFHEETSPDELTDQISSFVLSENLYGVDLSREAVEITQLALWIRSAEKGKTLANLSANIVCGNSLVSDPEVHPSAMVWEDVFQQVFKRQDAGFDCVIGNPPWERMKLQEREFFDGSATKIATAVNASDRRKLIDELKTADPELYTRYENAKDDADKTLTYVRQCKRYPLTGKGDINTYAVFTELASCIVSPVGCVGLLVPSGIATDHTTKEFFSSLVDSQTLYGLYDFENKAPIFPDVHRAFKFSVFLFSGKQLQTKECDFVFFAHRMADLDKPDRRINLSADDIKLVNPNTRTCPIFRSRRDAELTKAIYRQVPILVDKNREEGGNPWGIKFLRMFDQTNDAGLFHTSEQLKKLKYKRNGAIWQKGKKSFLPLYEAKMIQMYDHRAAGVEVKDENWMRQGQTVPTSQVQHQNPEFTVAPRWWVEEFRVRKALGDIAHEYFLGFKDITSPTNQRTLIASALPVSGITNHFPILVSPLGSVLRACHLANFNSIVLDFVVRQKIGGVTLNFFIVEQLPIFPPDFYSKRCPWDAKQTLEEWISERVLKLTCTSNDMIPLAEAAGFNPTVHKWDPAERADLMAQLDAAYFHMYGLGRDDVDYVLSTFQGIQKEHKGPFGGQGTYDLILKHYDALAKQG